MPLTLSGARYRWVLISRLSSCPNAMSDISGNRPGLSNLLITIFLIVGLSLVSFCGTAQTFPGTGGLLIPPGAPGQTIGITTSTATVSGIGILGSGCNEIANVTIDLIHTFDGDLGIFLISPTGEALELSTGNGGGGDNYTNTIFTDNAAMYITQGAAPFSGEWRPEGRQQNIDPPYGNAPLGTFTFVNTFTGVNADGDWTLYINDFLGVDVGVLNSWSITFNAGGGPAPEADLGPDITICPGESVTLEVDVTPGADSYAWSTGQTTPTINVSPAATTTYIVTVTNNGCMDRDTITVVVDFNALNADAGPDVAICDGETVTLTATGGNGGGEFNWSNGDTGPTIMVSPSTTTTYTVTISEGTCMSIDDVTVTVNPQPVADAGEPVEICDGESITLTATGGNQPNQYTWSNGQSGQSITVAPFQTTTYTVTVDINGCTSTDEVTVTVFPAPAVDVGPDLEICDGQTITLTANGTGGTYIWSTGETGTQIQISPFNSTLYSVTLTENGCEAVDEIWVEVVVVTAEVTPPSTICEGESVVLEASGGTTYEWSTGQASSTITVFPGITTLYTVTVSTGICTDIANVLITVEPAIDYTITPDQEICQGESVELLVEGGDTYEWSNGNTASSITVSPATSTLYTVTISGQSCSIVADVWVTVHLSPEVDAGPDIHVCEGESATLAVDPFGAGSIVWSTGEAGPSITVTPADTTVYMVTVTTGIGCTNTDEVTVFVHPYPTANAGPDIFLLPGESTMLTATGGGTYLWSTGETTSSITVTPTETTTYHVTISENGCSAVDEVTIFVDEPPVVNIGPDLIICQGETVNLDATIPGPFVVDYVWSNGETVPMISVSPQITTWYSVTVTDPASGFSSVDSILITVNTLPVGPVMIQGATESCLGDTVVYIVQDVSGATSYQWNPGPSGTIISGQNTTSITVVWTTVPAGAIELIVANSCGELPAEQLVVEINGLPAMPGPIDGPLHPCHSGIYTYQIPMQSGVVSWQWTISSGVIVHGQGTTSISVDWTGSSGGDVCVMAMSDCGESAVACIQVVTTSTPSIDAGEDMGVCGLSTSMQGSGSGTWSLIDGPGTAIFTVPDDPNSEVMVSSYGNYTFAFSIDNNGCNAEDEVTIAFQDNPVVFNILEACSADLTSYTVTFQIMNGNSPYLVNNNWITGSAFTSIPIQAGTPYQFEVVDANGCAALVVNGIQDCSCITKAGTLEATPKEVCIGEMVIVEYPGGEILDADDIIGFVLHDGLIPEGILAWNSEPVFGFLQVMVPGATYFISAVAGNMAGSGFPDPADPCFAISTGVPVTFHEIPKISAIVTPPSCTADCNGEIEILATQPNLLFDFGTGIPDHNPHFQEACSGDNELFVVNALTGCSMDTILVVPVPEKLSVNLGPDRTIETGDSIVLSAETSQSVVLYNWLGGVSPCTTCKELVVSPMVTTTYQVEVEDEGGCIATDDVIVTVNFKSDLYLPNVFSPNHDGINDRVYIGENPAIQHINLFEIYDRWGNLVFRRDHFLPGNIEDGWDGSCRGKQMLPGVFVCHIRYLDPGQTERYFVWDVTLVR